MASRSTTTRCARFDSLLHGYIGKVYRDPEGNGHEVLSIGVEAIHSGRYGGLVGASAQYPRDGDMRHLVLGILAAAGWRR